MFAAINSKVSVDDLLHGAIIPSGNDVIHEGDTVILLTKAAARPAVERLFKQRAH